MNGKSKADEHLRDNARLLSLAETGLLAPPKLETLDRHARIASRALDAPVSLVSLVSEERQFFCRCAWPRFPLARAAPDAAEPFFLPARRE